jgi:hypothetical protein
MSGSNRPKRIRAGDLSALKRRLWEAILTAGDLLDHDDPATRLRAVHALGQSAGVYRAILADSDLEQRLQALEQRVGESSR